MNDDDKRMFLALVKGKDISEIMSLLAESDKGLLMGLTAL